MIVPDLVGQVGNRFTVLVRGSLGGLLYQLPEVRGSLRLLGGLVVLPGLPAKDNGKGKGNTDQQ